jgi:hypothetical protein
MDHRKKLTKILCDSDAAFLEVKRRGGTRNIWRAGAITAYCPMHRLLGHRVRGIVGINGFTDVEFNTPIICKVRRINVDRSGSLPTTIVGCIGATVNLITIRIRAYAMAMRILISVC